MTDIIEKALNVLNIPIEIGKYDGYEKAYIIYQFQVQDKESFDDEVDGFLYNIELNYWCEDKSEIGLFTEIIKLMKEQGCSFNGSFQRFDDGFFGMTLKFIYENLEE